MRSTTISRPTAALFTLALTLVASAGPSFEITLPESAEPFTGRLYIALSPQNDEGQSREPRLAMHAWFNPPPVFSFDIRDLAPGSTVALPDDALAHPIGPDELTSGRWSVQAIARVNPDSPKAGEGEGDLYSEPQTLDLSTDGDAQLTLVLDQTVPAPEFTETDRVKLFEMRSPALSAFHGRDFTIRAGVRFPENHDPSRKYPVVVYVTGFGGDHNFIRSIDRIESQRDTEPADAIVVVPDPLCYRGHSVFADSANNGPWGAALVHELLPAIDAEYGGAGPEARFVTGVSSGGWSSLWLQITYPDHFAGCWSHVPDPVAFRDFQYIDLHAPDANMYKDEFGDPRPLARRNGEVMLLYKDFVDRETVLGPGGQIHSFEAVFSPKDADGHPRPLFDRETGAVDPVTAESWAGYDIERVLIERWDELAPKIKGKITVHAGEVDNFYLETAVAKLQKTLERLGSDADVRVIEGLAHTISNDAFYDMQNAINEAAERLKNAEQTN